MTPDQTELNLQDHETQWFLQLENSIKELNAKRQGALELLLNQHQLKGQWTVATDYTKLILQEPAPQPQPIPIKSKK